MARSISLLVLLVISPCVLSQELSESLWSAARKGDAAAVKALLAKGADVNAKAAYGATALSFAADKGHVEVVKVLLEHKADLNVKDTFYNATPLSWAVSKQHGAVVKLLIEAGAEQPETTLAFAARTGDLDLVKLVLDKSKPKQPTLDAALAAAKDKKISELLEKAGAKAAVVEPSKLDPEALKSYAGKYRNEESALEYDVSVDKDQLVIKFSGVVAYRLRALAKDKFHVTTTPEMTMDFHRDGDKLSVRIANDGKELMRLTKTEPRAAPVVRKVDDKAGPVTAPANWPSFRGPGATGVADGQFPPVTWDADRG
jgi:Ankyrin repeats (3 copies)/Domain of unknown function (DUF3471)